MKKIGLRFCTYIKCFKYVCRILSQRICLVELSKKFHFSISDLSHLDPSIIYEFLRESSELMENFIRDYVSMEELETWLALKSFEKFQEKLSITSFDGM